MRDRRGGRWSGPDATRPVDVGPSGGPITLDQTGVETYAVVLRSPRVPSTAG